MNRRDFMRGAAVSAVLMSSVTTLARADEKQGSGEKEGGELLRLKDRDNPSVLEQKHVPAVEAPGQVKKGEWFDVKVRVGFMQQHPSTPEHWITFIKLLVDGRKVAKVKNEVGGPTWPNAVFRIRLDQSATIEAVDNCNLHGTWIGDPVTVNVT